MSVSPVVAAGQESAGRYGRRRAAVLVPLVAVAATIVYALVADRTFPLRHWLFFLYAKYWLFVALFVASSAVAGWRLLARLVDEPPPLGERLLLALGVGVLVFVLGIFVVGLCGLLDVVFFFAW